MATQRSPDVFAVTKLLLWSATVATRKLTKRAIDALPTRDRVYIAYDNVLPGFGCRVTPNGARSWIVEYRPMAAAAASASGGSRLGRFRC